MSTISNDLSLKGSQNNTRLESGEQAFQPLLKDEDWFTKSSIESIPQKEELPINKEEAFEAVKFFKNPIFGRKVGQRIQKFKTDGMTALIPHQEIKGIRRSVTFGTNNSLTQPSTNPSTTYIKMKETILPLGQEAVFLAIEQSVKETASLNELFRKDGINIEIFNYINFYGEKWIQDILDNKFKELQYTKTQMMNGFHTDNKLATEHAFPIWSALTSNIAKSLETKAANPFPKEIILVLIKMEQIASSQYKDQTNIKHVVLTSFFLRFVIPKMSPPDMPPEMLPAYLALHQGLILYISQLKEVPENLKAMFLENTF